MGIEKKAAVRGGVTLGVVDRTVCWMYGDGMTTGGPTASGNVPRECLTPGEIGLTAGAGVGCTTCPELCSVDEVEVWVWDWLAICKGTTTPGIEGNACCGPIGIMTGPFTCEGSAVAGCCVL